MHTAWSERGETRSVTAPLSLIVTAFAPVSDVRRALTPELWADGDDGASELLLVDLGRGKNRLGGSALAQVYGQLGADAARSRRSRAAHGLLRGRSRSCRPRSVAARVPRSLRRRPVRDAGRDGVRGRRRPGHRDRRPRATIRSRACSPRSWARCCGARRATSRACAARPARRTASATPCARSATCSAAIAIILRRDGRTRVRGAAQHPARHLVRDDARDAGAARRPDLRRRGAGRARRRERSGPVGRDRRSTSTTTSRRRCARAAARARAWRSCASRASTARSRWPRPSIAPASRRSTCT